MGWMVCSSWSSNFSWNIWTWSDTSGTRISAQEPDFIRNFQLLHSGSGVAHVGACGEPPPPRTPLFRLKFHRFIRDGVNIRNDLAKENSIIPLKNVVISFWNCHNFSRKCHYSTIRFTKYLTVKENALFDVTMINNFYTETNWFEKKWVTI